MAKRKFIEGFGSLNKMAKRKGFATREFNNLTYVWSNCLLNLNLLHIKAFLKKKLPNR